jgi:6-phosphogluconolactonase/glucosamine-6-phosphate isomerase/deaminase
MYRFNLDQYYPISNDALQSYQRFMKVNLFNHIDIDQKYSHSQWRDKKRRHQRTLQAI